MKKSIQVLFIVVVLAVFSIKYTATSYALLGSAPIAGLRLDSDMNANRHSITNIDSLLLYTTNGPVNVLTIADNCLALTNETMFSFLAIDALGTRSVCVTGVASNYYNNGVYRYTVELPNARAELKTILSGATQHSSYTVNTEESLLKVSASSVKLETQPTGGDPNGVYATTEKAALVAGDAEVVVHASNVATITAKDTITLSTSHTGKVEVVASSVLLKTLADNVVPLVGIDSTQGVDAKAASQGYVRDNFVQAVIMSPNAYPEVSIKRGDATTGKAASLKIKDLDTSLSTSDGANITLHNGVATVTGVLGLDLEGGNGDTLIRSFENCSVAVDENFNVDANGVAFNTRDIRFDLTASYGQPITTFMHVDTNGVDISAMSLSNNITIQTVGAVSLHTSVVNVNGLIDMHQNPICNVAAPINASDAVSKQYADTHYARASSGILTTSGAVPVNFIDKVYGSGNGLPGEGYGYNVISQSRVYTVETEGDSITPLPVVYGSGSTALTNLEYRTKATGQVNRGAISGQTALVPMFIPIFDLNGYVPEFFLLQPHMFKITVTDNNVMSTNTPTMLFMHPTSTTGFFAERISGNMDLHILQPWSSPRVKILSPEFTSFTYNKPFDVIAYTNNPFSGQIASFSTEWAKSTTTNEIDVCTFLHSYKSPSFSNNTTITNVVDGLLITGENGFHTNLTASAIILKPCGDTFFYSKRNNLLMFVPGDTDIQSFSYKVEMYTPTRPSN